MVNNNNSNNNNNNNNNKVFNLGDSIVKYIQSWKIKKLNNKQKVYVRHFSGSEVRCMKDYVKPSICENNPVNIIFHVGTKDVE